MEPHALTHLAAHKLFHPSAAFREHGIASANVINHGHLAVLHEALGAWAAAPRHRYDFHKYCSQPGDHLLANGLRQHAAYLGHVAAGTVTARAEYEPLGRSPSRPRARDTDPVGLRHVPSAPMHLTAD